MSIENNQYHVRKALEHAQKIDCAELDCLSRQLIELARECIKGVQNEITPAPLQKRVVVQ